MADEIAEPKKLLTFNLNLANLLNLLGLLAIQVIACTSGRTDSYRKDDLTRLKSFCAKFRKRLVHAGSDTDGLDLSASDPTTYEYNAFPVWKQSPPTLQSEDEVTAVAADPQLAQKKGVRNLDVILVLQHMETSFHELEIGVTARSCSGINQFDKGRVEAILARIDHSEKGLIKLIDDDPEVDLAETGIVPTPAPKT